MSEMKVTLVANASQPVSEIAKLTASANETAKSFTATAKAAADGSKAAAGSFTDLRVKLAAARTELDRLAEGTPEFVQQATVVKALSAEFTEAKNRIAQLTAAEAGLSTGTAALNDQSKAVKAVAGSYAALEAELKDNVARLKEMQSGTPEYNQQAEAVKKLATAFDAAKRNMAELTTAESQLATGTAALNEQTDAAKAAAGSYRALKTELQENIQKLEGMAAGTAEFAAQKRKVDDLRASVDKVGAELETTAQAAVGSFKRLEAELQANEAALKGMAIGSQQFDAQRKKVDQLKNSLEKAKGELAGASKLDSWGGVATSMGVATGAALLLYNALQQVAEAQRQLIGESADAVVAVDEMGRRLQIQAGLTDPQREQQTAEIIRQSTDAGVKAEVGFQAATQLAGSGFEDSVDSGSLKTVLDTIQASSFKGNPEELVSAFTESLNAYGLEKTNNNLQNIAVAAQSLFKQTDFQLTELADFAKQAAVFEAANISMTQSMAAFTALREVLPAAESGTGLRNFVSILQAGAGTKESTEALGRLGLKPDQVDFVGENLTEVITRINQASAGMKEEDRNVALSKVFGRENVASARLLLGSTDRVKELEALQQNKEQFNVDRGVAAASLQSQRNRQDNNLLLARMPIGAKVAEIDARVRDREKDLQFQTEKAAASGIPFLGAAAVASAKVINTADNVIGENVLNEASKGLFEVFQSFGRSKADVEAKFKAAEQRPVNEAVKAVIRPAGENNKAVAAVVEKPVAQNEATAKPVAAVEMSTATEDAYYSAWKKMVSAEPNRANSDRFYDARGAMMSQRPSSYKTEDDYERAVIKRIDQRKIDEESRRKDATEDLLKAQIRSLDTIAAGMQELNSRVAGSPPSSIGRGNQAPVRPAPVPRPAIVP